MLPVSKLAIVTGASRGIGATISRVLAEHGMGVLMLARSEQGLSDVSNYIQAEGGYPFVLPVDLSLASDVEKVVRFVDQFEGDLTTVIHNAGIARVGKIENLSLADWRRVLDMNLTAPFMLTQKLIPKMKSGGQFIFVNSVAGKTAFPEWAAYSASKFGLRAFADTLRQEVRSKGIRVTTIFPSAVDTKLHEDLPYNWDRSKMLKSVDVANAVIYCIKQPASININEIDMENMAGIF